MISHSLNWERQANYHEMMAHVPVHAIQLARRARPEQGPLKLRALILGGGDGGVAARLLEHNSVTSVTMVEIDSAVVTTCRTYFDFSRRTLPDPKGKSHGPAVAGTSTSDRVRLIFADATAWVALQPPLPADQRSAIGPIIRPFFVLRGG